MDSTLAGDQHHRKSGKATGTWVITVALVLLLVALAVTAAWWMPVLMAKFPGGDSVISKASDWLQLSLWLMAALFGALGVRRALDESDSRPPVKDAAKRPAEEAPAAAPRRSTTARRSRPRNGKDPEKSAATVSFYTDGGVRIIAEEGILELDEKIDRKAADLPVPAQADETSSPPATDGSRKAQAGPALQSDRGTIAGEGRPPQQSAPLLAAPFNLPADLPDFTGRAGEIAEVQRWLSAESERQAMLAARPGVYDASGQTLTISGIAGMGGIGKTTLALHVAHKMAREGHFPDAQLYIDLKGTAQEPIAPEAALKTLLTALLGADAERPNDLDSLARLWRGAMQAKRALIILDNAANAAQVRPLLPDSPTCTVLITSRQRFGIPGGHLVELNRLPRAESRKLLQTLAPRLSDATADEIAQRCGGLPLALRIAGNYLGLNDDFPAEDYAARLADEQGRMSHLRDPQDPDLDVAATLSLSIGQLDVGNRWAWTMLALFPAPFDSTSAAAAWGEGVARTAWSPLDEETTIAWLSALRNRSLVTYEPDADRYRLHDLLYLAASQELESTDEVDRARARLAYHFLSVARGVDKSQHYLDLDPDWPHLRAALEFAQEKDPRLLSDLVLALNNYWSARGMTQERAHWNQQASATRGSSVHDEAIGIHLANQGIAYADRGDARQAIEVYGRALALSRGTGNQQLEGAQLGNLGQAYQALGDARRAVHYYEQALEIAQAVGDRHGEGVHLGNMGHAYVELGEPRQAIDYLEQALAIARDLGDRHMEGTHLGNLGRAYSELGDARQAIAWQQEALAIHRQIGNLRGEANALDRLGRATIDLGQPERAIDYYEQALEITRAAGDRRAQGWELGSLGLAHKHMGDPERAISYYRQALAIAQEIGDRRSEGACLGNLGCADLELGHTSRAMTTLKEALLIAQQVGDRRSEATWLGELGEAYAQLGDLQQAEALQQQALAVYQEIGDRRSEGNRLASLGLIARQQGDEDRAHEVWTNALQTFEAIKDPSASRVWKWLADLEGQAV